MEANQPEFDMTALPVRIFGMDRDGKPFFQLATARNLSSDAAVLCGLEHPVKPGDIVGVQYQGAKVRARVLWACELGSEFMAQAGVQLIAGSECPWKPFLEVEKSSP